MAARRGHSNGGRRSKGERRLVVTRLSPELADQVAATAEDRGLTVSDYLAQLVYSDLGVDGGPGSTARVPANSQQLQLSA